LSLVLDLRRLAVLRAVAREGSLSAAARALDYTQPAVSHHVARLEEEVGTALFVRTSRGVRLTEAGQALVDHADAVVARLQAAEEEVAEIAELRKGRLRLAAFPSASATLVPLAARSVRNAHPGVSVSLVEAEPPEALALLRAGEVDLALAFGYPEAELAAHRDLDIEPLLEDELLFVLPTTRRSRRVRLSDLRDETWIAGCERCRAHLLHLTAQAEFEPNIAYATDDYVTVQGLVAAGLGVTILPSLALAAHRRNDIRAVPVGRSATRQIAIVTLPGRRRPPAVELMIGLLRRACAGLTTPAH
jgi:molybdate transport repressor ModE-like protein